MSSSCARFPAFPHASQTDLIRSVQKVRGLDTGCALLQGETQCCKRKRSIWSLGCILVCCMDALLGRHCIPGHKFVRM